MKACMGGYCRKRDGCAHYGLVTQAPAERLCIPGRDGILKRPPQVEELAMRPEPPAWVPVHFERRVAA